MFDIAYNLVFIVDEQWISCSMEMGPDDRFCSLRIMSSEQLEGLSVMMVRLRYSFQRIFSSCSDHQRLVD